MAVKKSRFVALLFNERKQMLYAITKSKNKDQSKPIKIVTWFYDTPGHLQYIIDSGGVKRTPSTLIPIGYKKYSQMVKKQNAIPVDIAVMSLAVALTK